MHIRGTTYALLIAAALFQQAHAESACESLKNLRLADTTVTVAEAHAAGVSEFAVSGPPGMRIPPTKANLPAYCRVAGKIHPTVDSDISFELWLPIEGWNHRYQQIGNGGLAGSVPLASMISPVQQGWAIAATDDGHVGTSMSDGHWALGHPEKIVDYGYRAVHLTAQRAQEIIRAFYQAKAAHRYFVGCSDGGRESLMEAQRYPADFDGFLAGAPASDVVGHAARSVQIVQAGAALGANQLSAAQSKLIGVKALEQCDAQDGVTDGVLRDPALCHLKLQELLCPAEKADTCLTQPQIDAVQGFYNDIWDPKSGRTLAYGYWSTLGTAVPSLSPQNPMVGVSQQVLANMVYGDPNLDLRSLDLFKVYEDTQVKIGAIVDPLSTDLRAARRSGKKIIQYHGWSDPLIPAEYSVAYFSAVQKSAGDTQDFYRLFLAPGMGHCGGGVGPTWIQGSAVAHDAEHDAVLALERWVEKGIAPDKIIATEFVDPGMDPLNGPAAGTAIRSTRPICPYPQVAVYDGHGDVMRAASFACRRP